MNLVGILHHGSKYTLNQTLWKFIRHELGFSNAPRVFEKICKITLSLPELSQFNVLILQRSWVLWNISRYSLLLKWNNIERYLGIYTTHCSHISYYLWEYVNICYIDKYRLIVEDIWLNILTFTVEIFV